MQITRSSIDTLKGPADWFTGDVYIDAAPPPPARRRCGRARALHPRRPYRLAHPSARSDDLRHRGRGPCQREGGPVETIRPGDRVFFEPGENHWHGAAPNRFMVHVAMQQADESGSPVTWGEHVSDEEYAAPPTSAS